MWFFKKRENNKDIENIQISLKNSFLNIKKDMEHINKHIGEKHSEYDIKHGNHEKQIQKLYNKILLLEEKIDSLNPKTSIKEEFIEKISVENNPKKINTPLHETLTDVQLELLQKLATISTISEKGWITTQALGKEMYPTKDYSSIRSLLSDYTAILSEFGLIEKKRKGRKTILTLTEKGKSFLPKEFYEKVNLKVENKKEKELE